jgi:hypothetical protein
VSRCRTHATRLLLVLLIVATAPGPSVVRPAATVLSAATALPDRLSDADFWKLMSDISEPGGYFRITDNYTSNEREVGVIFTMLRERGVEGGVYLGVGPEQNFTYIAATRPAMAFILDIRRQAVMQHLMFKAIFGMAKDRADFISVLFAKPRPAGLGAETPIQDMWNAFADIQTDSSAAAQHATRIVERLTKTHQFGLTSEEIATLRSVYEAFVAYGPAISTRGSGGGGGGRGGGGTFAELTGWMTDATGSPQSFLSTEANFLAVKALQDKNLIVPVSGDFGGPKALRAIGAYLRKQGAVVQAYYVSNVEQYLFQDGKSQAFYENVATLPLDERSVFIRPYAFRNFGSAEATLCPVERFVNVAATGRINSNNEALACMR